MYQYPNYICSSRTNTDKPDLLASLKTSKLNGHFNFLYGSVDVKMFSGIRRTISEFSKIYCIYAKTFSSISFVNHKV